MFRVYEYTTVNGNRRSIISKKPPQVKKYFIIFKGNLDQCKLFLYPNGDADDEIEDTIIAFIPKY